MSKFFARFKRKKPNPDDLEPQMQEISQIEQKPSKSNINNYDYLWNSVLNPGVLNTIPNALTSIVNEPNGAVYAFLGVTTLFAGAKLVNYVNDALKNRDSESMFEHIVDSSKIDKRFLLFSCLLINLFQIS